MTMQESLAWSKEFDVKFSNKYNRLMTMTKADIVKEGITWDIWANSQSTADYLIKHHTKKDLAEILAGRLIRLESRGY